jgi:ApaG protein
LYALTTRSIRVSVEPFYLAEQSQPEDDRWVFGYRVTIENRGAETVQLMSRHWRITDAAGRVTEVRGPGVVGEQPRLAPGERFEYASGAPLPTPSGFMTGTYLMVADSGETFDVAIPTFSLDAPGVPRALN